jgi:putative hydrolase of the HAD superfamily
LTRIKGILIDLYGTIIPRPSRERHDRFIQFISNETGINIDTVKTTWRGVYHRRVTGKLGPIEKEIEQFLIDLGSDKNKGIRDTILSEYYQLSKDLVVPFDDVEPALRSLRDEGIKIGLLTNCSRNLPPIFESLVINSLFDSRTYSSMEGLTKPQLELFSRACKALGVEHERCLFVGDGDNQELQGAQKAGLMPVMIERGPVAGDYLISPTEEWEPLISSFSELKDIISTYHE